MSETDVRVVLSELATVRSSGEPIASLYLDTRWRDPRAREESQLFVRERIQAEPAVS